MRPRVLIVAHANPSWTQYYVEAFRQLAEIVFIGTPMKDEIRRRWFPGLCIPPSVIPDVPIDFDSMSLRHHVPTDFVPDLVVGISGVGGDPLPAEIVGFACPTALITVDTWQCILDYPQARRFDYVFAAQREFVLRLQAIGARNVCWLPLACAPDHHRPGSSVPTADIAFGGSLDADIHRRRRELIEALQQRFSVYIEKDAFGSHLCEVYARGRLGLNHCAVDEINMRVFEVMAMGRPLLVNRGPVLNGLLDLFADGEHIIAYDGVDDLLRQVAVYLADERVRNRVAAEGRRLVLERHTYRNRAETILAMTLSDSPVSNTWRDTARLTDFLPHGLGRVLDVGMRLESSRYALRKRGATEVIGVPTAGSDTETRRTSYDAVATWPPAGMFDTVVLSDGFAHVRFEEVLAALEGRMPAGGVLVARVPGSVTDHGETLRAHGLYVIQSERFGEDFVVVARRFTRSVREVVIETFREHPETGYDPLDIAARVPEGL